MTYLFRIAMDSLLSDALLFQPLTTAATVLRRPTGLAFFSRSVAPLSRSFPRRRPIDLSPVILGRISAARNGALISNRTQSNNSVYTVGDFMTKKENLIIVKPSTAVDEALEKLVEYRITGFPVIDDDWTLVGVVSDYDLLALDSISGCGVSDRIMFPEVDSTWKTFNELHMLLSKTNGKTVGDVMTPVPLVVQETSELEAAARLFLETKYRRLPVVNAAGELIGIITRGNIITAALHLKRAREKRA
ncbi:hypothetical protein KSP39_PZI022244 [Platanthera zijinensis]|uniref:CBS domain-containing protein n=1 Tax=Platanthera zijinensis TaxID=2320716 RepID=A0AAP0AUF0_9ASPA